ncbi:MAG: hypothetical protein HY722_14995 [Planctomycetes bacterium]|nr:hypothetical protein [Planctomycetota bacterium]
MLDAWTVVLVALIVLLAAEVLAPLLGPRRAWEATHVTALESLVGEKARVLRALKDLEHERASGLLEEADYQEARRDYLGRAVRLNRAIAGRGERLP